MLLLLFSSYISFYFIGIVISRCFSFIKFFSSTATMINEYMNRVMILNSWRQVDTKIIHIPNKLMIVWIEIPLCSFCFCFFFIYSFIYIFFLLIFDSVFVSKSLVIYFHLKCVKCANFCEKHKFSLLLHLLNMFVVWDCLYVIDTKLKNNNNNKTLNSSERKLSVNEKKS